MKKIEDVQTTLKIITTNLDPSLLQSLRKGTHFTALPSILRYFEAVKYFR